MFPLTCYIGQFLNLNPYFSGVHGDVAEGIHCYNLAIEIYCRTNRTAFAATLHSEVANALIVFNHLDEASEHFSFAGELLRDSSALASIGAYENAIDCNIRAQNYELALSVL